MMSYWKILWSNDAEIKVPLKRQSFILVAKVSSSRSTIGIFILNNPVDDTITKSKWENIKNNDTYENISHLIT